MFWLSTQGASRLACNAGKARQLDNPMLQDHAMTEKGCVHLDRDAAVAQEAGGGNAGVDSARLQRDLPAAGAQLLRCGWDSCLNVSATC